MYTFSFHLEFTVQQLDGRKLHLFCNAIVLSCLIRVRIHNFDSKLQNDTRIEIVLL